jgi:nitrogenase molybdenum-iron protein alpha/beta subunit
MSSKNGFLDEQGMVDLARKTIEDLRKEGASPTELKRLENILKDGSVGESLILSGLLRTIRNEISPDASHKKLLQIYEGVEECCYCLVELSHNLFDVEAWQHYRQSGYEGFETYCTEVLHISAEQAERLKLIRDRSLPQRGKKGPGPFFDWLFQAAEILAGAKKSHDL